MIEPIAPKRQSSNGRSNVAIEILLNLYAVVCVVVLARVVLEIASVDHRVWIGSVVYRVTDPVVAPLERLPGAGVDIVGNLDLPDITLLALIILLPLGIVARGDRAPRSRQP